MSKGPSLYKYNKRRGPVPFASLKGIAADILPTLREGG